MHPAYLILIAALVFTMAFAVVSYATVPAPPANQLIGIPDGVLNDLEEPDCRICHENPDQFPVKPESIPDRHHLLVDASVPDGICSRSDTLCQPNAGIDCPLNADVCLGASAAPFPPPPGGNYTCFSCHDVDCSTGVCDINVYRDCLLCHTQIDGDASVHHITAPAQIGDCVSCHGDIVDNMDDGHTIPLYDPSLATPRPSGGDGLPLNSEGSGAGACNYCHSTGTGTLDPGTDIDTDILVYRNSTTHHTTVVSDDFDKCEWCHNMEILPEFYIRVCEGCHGYESLHNIQADSQPDGQINAGSELAGYGHIGNDDDCWGCHGYASASGPAPGTGPVAPTIISTDVSVVTAGSDAAIILWGASFTNLDDGYEWVSTVFLTASNGSTFELVPDSISQDVMTVTIPGILAAGNYALRAVKGGTESNPVVISVKPNVVITDIYCSSKRGLLSVEGAGFGEKIEGTDAYINIEVNSVPADILFWSDNQIRASVSGCTSRTAVTVNALFGSARSGEGKPPKPCKGKGCNK